MPARPRCQSSPTCTSTGISTSRSKVEGTEDGRQTRDLPVDRGGVVLLQRRAERGGIERCRSHRIGCRGSGRASRHGEAEQVRVREPGEAPDAVSLLDRLPQQPQARDIGVRVHPPALVADGGDRVMTPLPGAQRIDADSGQSGDGADRVVRGGACSPDHDPDGRRARR